MTDDDRFARLAALLRKMAKEVNWGAPCGALEQVAVAIDQSAEPVAKPTVHWFGPFTYEGGGCPVPDGTMVRWKGTRCQGSASAYIWASWLGKQFSYAADNPEGWLPRPAGWVPQGVKCRFEVRAKGSVETKFFDGEMPEWWWAQVTHIRLLPHEPAAPGLPKFWEITTEGNLLCGNVLVAHASLLRHATPDAIRQAVDYWLAEMQRRAG
jgi:hypothetical protein